MLEKLNVESVIDALYEISENGDYYGYDSDESGYYQDYKPQFDELSAAASDLIDTIQNFENESFDGDSHWNDIAVGLLGLEYNVLGYDSAEYDYFKILNPWDEGQVVYKSAKRIKRMTKDEIIKSFSYVFRTVLLFMDIKAAHNW